MNDIITGFFDTEVQAAQTFISNLMDTQQHELTKKNNIHQQVAHITERMTAIKELIREIFTPPIDHPVDAKTLAYIESTIKSKTTSKVRFSTDENDIQQEVPETLEEKLQREQATKALEIFQTLRKNLQTI